MLTAWPVRRYIYRRSVDEADQWLNDDPGPQPQQKKLPKPKQPPKQEAAKEEAASKQVGFSAQKQEGRNETADQKTTDFRSRGLPKKSQSMKED